MRDKDFHLLSLSVVPQMRDSLIFKHWKAEPFPAGTVACVKAACQYFNTDGNACPQKLTAQVYDLKRHLKNVHSVGDTAIASTTFIVGAPR